MFCTVSMYSSMNECSALYKCPAGGMNVLHCKNVQLCKLNDVLNIHQYVVESVIQKSDTTEFFTIIQRFQ